MPKIIHHLRKSRPLTITGLFALAACVLLTFLASDFTRAANPAIGLTVEVSNMWKNGVDNVDKDDANAAQLAVGGDVVPGGGMMNQVPGSGTVDSIALETNIQGPGAGNAVWNTYGISDTGSRTLLDTRSANVDAFGHGSYNAPFSDTAPHDYEYICVELVIAPHGVCWRAYFKISKCDYVEGWSGTYDVANDSSERVYAQKGIDDSSSTNKGASVNKDGELEFTVELVLASGAPTTYIDYAWSVIDEDGKEVDGGTMTALTEDITLTASQLKGKSKLRVCLVDADQTTRICCFFDLPFGCDSCSSGNCQTTATASVGSMEYTMPVGAVLNGEARAYLTLYQNTGTDNPGMVGVKFAATDDFTVTEVGGVLDKIEGEWEAKLTAAATGADPDAFLVTISDSTATVIATHKFENVVDGGTSRTLMKITYTYAGKTWVTEYDRIAGAGAGGKGVGEKWIMTTGNGLRRETVETLTYTSAAKSERVTVEELKADATTWETVSQRDVHYQIYPWGREMVKTVIDPLDEALTSEWEYEAGKLKSYTRHDGYAENHTYSATVHTIKKPFEGTLDALVETVTESPAGTTTRESKVGGNLISKSVTIRATDKVTRRTYTDAGNYLETITEFYPSSSEFASQAKKTSRPDGTVTLYEYTRSVSTGDKTTTVYNGHPGGSNIDAGTETISISDAIGQPQSSMSTDIAANLTIGQTTYSNFDVIGRAQTITTLTGVTTRTFACCGMDSATDIYGITTTYGYDDLRRRTTTERLGVVSKTVYDGRTTAQHRYLSLGSASATNKIGYSVQNLSGTVRDSYSRSAQDGTLVKTTATTTYAPSASIGEKVVTSYPLVTDDGGSAPTQTSESYLDGRSYQSYGDMAPHMRYDYAGGSAGLETERSIVDGVHLREAVTTKTDLAGRSTSVLYSGAGSPTATVAYNSSGQMISSTDPDGVTTLFAYNNEGERTTTALDLDDDGVIDYGVDTVTHSQADTVTAHSETVQRTITKVWKDATTELVLSHSDRAVTGLKNWSISYPGSTAEESSSVTDLGTAGDGDWIVTATDPTGAYTKTTYTDGLTEKAESFDASDTLLAKTTYTTYDSFNRPTVVTDARTGATTTAYYNDYVDSVASVTAPGSRTTAFTYDHRGRRTEVDAPDTLDEDGATLANETTTTYFKNGTVDEVDGGQTYKRSNTYDYAQRMVTMTTYGTATAVTEWVYDDERGWLTRKEFNSPSGKGTDYTYTAAGRLATRTWARDIDGGDPAASSKARLSATYLYDDGGRLDTVTYNDTATQDLDYSYDHHGRPTEVDQGTVTTHSYAYNSADLLLDTETVRYDTNGDGDTIDAADIVRVIDRDYEDGTGATVARRPSGFELRDTVPNVEHSVGYHYEADTGRLLGVDASGVPNLTGESYAFEYTYGVSNSAHLLSAVETPAHIVTNTWLTDRDALDKKENKVGASTRSSYDYAVNKLTQRTGVATAGDAFGTAPTIGWGYNSRGELVSADSDSGTTDDRHYSFDAIGNRSESRVGTDTDTGGTATSYTPTVLNQYSAIGSANPEHDLDGNLTEGGLESGALTGTSGTSYTGTLTWDAENRLVEVEDATPATKATYAYDYMGRRIRKTAGGVSTWYIYDGWNVVAEYEGATPALTLTYTWGTDLSGGIQGAGGVGGLLSVSDEDASGDPVYYPTYDGNGNVSEYLDSTGATVAHYEYDPFGGLTASTGSKAADFKIRFSTKMLEDETGLYYYGYRYYDPVTGRWPSRDPIEEQGFALVSSGIIRDLIPQGLGERMNNSKLTYALVENEPVGSFDLLGLDREVVGGVHKGLVLENWKVRDGKYVLDNPDRWQWGFGAENFSYILGHACFVTLVPIPGVVWHEYPDEFPARLAVESNPCQDILAEAKLSEQESNPPFYSLSGFNCQDWAKAMLLSAMTYTEKCCNPDGTYWERVGI